MPRKKADTPAQSKTTRKEAAPTPPKQDAITLTLEVTPEQYSQMQRVADMNGQTVDEWLRDIIADNV